MQPLRDEHMGLIPQVEHLREVADAVGEASSQGLTLALDVSLGFLTHRLYPHAHAEDRLLGGAQATASMTRDHQEIGRLTGELYALRDTLAGRHPETTPLADLRRVLYGTYALVRLHFTKEEEIFLPLLDANLSTEEAIRIFSAMGEAAKEAQAH